MGGSESKASTTTPATSPKTSSKTKAKTPSATNVSSTPKKTHKNPPSGNTLPTSHHGPPAGSSVPSTTPLVTNVSITPNRTRKNPPSGNTIPTSHDDPPAGSSVPSTTIKKQDSKGNHSSTKGKQPSDMMRSVKREKLIVAAIDFGTAFSGFAWCARVDYTDSTPHINVQSWSATTTMTNKAPTCVLLNSDKSVRSFGYEANTEFQEADNISDCYFFKHFKMKLYEEKESLSKERTKLKDESGKELPAIEVFAAVIGHFKERLLSKLLQKDDGVKFKSEDIHWVITVPAIWNLKAKQFMREAADMAGIKDNQLTLALEPEAASLYCRKVPNSVKTEGNNLSIASFPVGSKYLIVDLGGGTLDMTAHEVLEGNGLKEIHQASGGYWGGQRVNDDFVKFLKSLFGNDVLCELREDCPSQWQELIDDFERKKCAYDPDSVHGRVTISVPAVLINGYKRVTECDLEQTIPQTSFAGKVEMKKSKLRMSKEFFESMFDQSITNVLKDMQKLLKEDTMKDVSTILLVGGYAESTLMQKKIKNKFKDNYRIIIPTAPQISVLQGAVIYGYEPEVIKSRVCRYTYGTACQRKFIPGYDDPKKIVRYGRGDFIDDVFDKHVEVGQVAKLHEFQEAKPYHPLDAKQTMAYIEFYVSDNKDPQFVTEESCTCLGFIEVNLSERRKSVDATVLVRINVSGTDIEVEAEEKATGNKTKAFCNFLG